MVLLFSCIRFTSFGIIGVFLITRRWYDIEVVRSDLVAGHWLLESVYVCNKVSSAMWPGK